MKYALLALAMCAVCYGQSNLDRTYYQEIDTNAWPGDKLAEYQVEAAVKHFHDDGACGKPWRWALIGPNEFLLKGTDYLLLRVPAGGRYEPNIHFSRGFWGGTQLFTSSVPEAERRVESEADNDCEYGQRKGRP